MTTVPDGPLSSTCTEAAISSFGLGGGTVSSDERQTVDGNFGACPRSAKSRSGGGPSSYIMVSLCMAGTLASPRCLLCLAVWVEVGNANMAFLTFIPCTVTSIFDHLPCLLSANILAFDRTHAQPIRLYCHAQEYCTART